MLKILHLLASRIYGTVPYFRTLSRCPEKSC